MQNFTLSALNFNSTLETFVNRPYINMHHCYFYYQNQLVKHMNTHIYIYVFVTLNQLANYIQF